MQGITIVFSSWCTCFYNLNNIKFFVTKSGQNDIKFGFFFGSTTIAATGTWSSHDNTATCSGFDAVSFFGTNEPTDQSDSSRPTPELIEHGAGNRSAVTKEIEVKEVKSCLRVKTLQESLYKSRGSDAPNLIPSSRSVGSVSSRSRLVSDDHVDSSLAGVMEEQEWDDDDSENEATTNRRNVAVAELHYKLQWGDIQIREYAQCLGDNPACSQGAPIQLDWNYQLVDVMRVDSYESCRVPNVVKDESALKISSSYRQFMLLGMGYTPQQLAAAVRLKTRDQRRRIQTVAKLRYNSNLDEQLEKMIKMFPNKVKQ